MPAGKTDGPPVVVQMQASQQDYAKYPFTREASAYVKSLDLRLDELDSPEYLPIVDRAEERIRQSLADAIVSSTGIVSSVAEAEILSYPVAAALVACIDDSFLRRRYALSEAKRIGNLLSQEDDTRLLNIAETTFDWHIMKQTSKHGTTNMLSTRFTDYLRNATGFHDDHWKLVNRRMNMGWVLLEKAELARLMSEEIKTKIERNLEQITKPDLTHVAPKLASRVEALRQTLSQRKESLRSQELPRSIVPSAYPPCIRALYDDLLAGKPLPHMARLALTSFLLTIGFKTDDLVKLYTSVSDFSESLTRYQVEHIAGQRGSGTKYNPPKCDTLKTHNLCQAPDDLCQRIWHPLTYYQQKARLLSQNGE
jgi:DNA primase large subunit